MNISDIKNIDYDGKAFVLDSDVMYFKVGSKWILGKEWEREGYTSYEGYLDETDADNPVVKAIVEAGGVVRRNISGKTDYFVVSDPNSESSKARDYNAQLEKGSSVIAIPVEAIIGGTDEGSESTEADFAEDGVYRDNYGLIEVYVPTGVANPAVYPDNVVVDEISITGDECKDWVYSLARNNKEYYVTDYVGDADEIILPSYIDGKRANLTWLGASGGGKFENCKAKRVLVPGTYKEIPPNFFVNNTSIEEIIIGTGVEIIGYAFCAGANNLKNAKLPDTVKNVGFNCLAGTKWIEDQWPEAIAGSVFIHKYKTSEDSYEDSVFCIPEGITCIAQHAFFGKDNQDPTHIRRIELPESAKYVSDAGFFGLRLESIRIPSTLEFIGKQSFRTSQIADFYENQKKESMLIIGSVLHEIYLNNCGSILEVPEGVKSISEEAMFGSGQIPDKVILSDSVEELGDNIQWWTMKEIELGSKLRKIGRRCFYLCRDLTEVALPDSLQEIGEEAFAKSGLKHITIPGSVKCIPAKAFLECEMLETVTILQGVETIDFAAFKGCKSLKSITIPASVEEVSEDAFERCGDVEIITT